MSFVIAILHCILIHSQTFDRWRSSLKCKITVLWALTAGLSCHFERGQACRLELQNIVEYVDRPDSARDQSTL